jgi:hypothetical protein
MGKFHALRQSYGTQISHYTSKTLDLLRTLTWTVVDDGQIFNCATTAQIREIGCQWTMSPQVDEELTSAVFIKIENQYEDSLPTEEKMLQDRL